MKEIDWSKVTADYRVYEAPHSSPALPDVTICLDKDGRLIRLLSTSGVRVDICREAEK